MNRALVIALPALWLAMVVVAWQGGNPWWLMGMAAVLLILMFVLMLQARWGANLPDRYADEYQRQRRDHAHRIAYWSLGLPTGLVAGLGWARLEQNYRAGTNIVIGVEAMPVLAILLLGGLVLWITLPDAILALTEPAPLNDDPQESRS